MTPEQRLRMWKITDELTVLLTDVNSSWDQEKAKLDDEQNSKWRDEVDEIQAAINTLLHAD